MIQKGIVLFDIDRTIFDTDGMIIDLDEALLAILGYPNTESFKKVEEDYIEILMHDRYFIPEDYVKMLCVKFNFSDQKKLLDVFYDDKYKHVYKDNVFPETIKVISILKNKFDFGIFSEGTSKFQNNKFRSMDLNKYFDKDLIFIVDVKDTREVIKRIPKSAIVIDDKEKICKFLTSNGIRAIWLNKKDDRISDKFQTIHNLLELPDKLM
jgi:FMN phosphatase YigB (HAD superfamily)